MVKADQTDAYYYTFDNRINKLEAIETKLRRVITFATETYNTHTPGERTELEIRNICKIPVAVFLNSHNIKDYDGLMCNCCRTSITFYTLQKELVFVRIKYEIYHNIRARKPGVEAESIAYFWKLGKMIFRTENKLGIRGALKAMENRKSVEKLMKHFNETEFRKLMKRD